MPALAPFGSNALSAGARRYVTVKVQGTLANPVYVYRLNKAPALCAWCGCRAYLCKGSCVL